MASEELQHALQRVSGTTLDSQGAANVWAGTGTTRANLCADPSYTRLAAWALMTANTTEAIDSTFSLFGSSSLKVTHPTVAGTSGVAYTEKPAIAAGETATLSVYVFSTIPLATFILGFSWYTAADALISTVMSGNLVVPANIWTRQSVTLVAPATAAYGTPKTTTNTTSYATTDTLWFDGMLLEKSPTLNPYFDGSSGGAWTGTPNASTSTLYLAGGLELVGALNAKAGTTGLELLGVLNVLAGTPGQGKGVNACAALFV